VRHLLLLLSVAIAPTLFAGPAAAATEAVGVFADQAGTDCGLQDRVIGACSFYVVHVNAVDRTGVEFWPQLPGCADWIYIGVRSTMPVYTGRIDYGFSVAYGQPLSGNIHVMTLDFFCQGLSSICCEMPMAPHLYTGKLVAADASHALHDIVGQPSVINPDHTCACNAVTAERTTWGKIKALYH